MQLPGAYFGARPNRRQIVGGPHQSARSTFAFVPERALNVATNGVEAVTDRRDGAEDVGGQTAQRSREGGHFPVVSDIEVEERRVRGRRVHADYAALGQSSPI